MAAKNEAKIRFIAETSEFTEEIREADQSMSVLRSEMRMSQAQFKANENSVRGLVEKKRLLQQQLQLTSNKVEALRQKLARAKSIYGENSTEVARLKVQLNNAQREYFETESAINDVNEALKKQKDKSKDAGEGFTVLKGVMANLASSAIQATLSAVRDLASGLWNLAEETRELRTEMGKLQAAFTASNFGAETAAATYETLYGIIGETDQSVEAAQQIALLANNTEDAARWADLAAGVVGTFGDALQPETFFEAANETLKLGEATGAFTQMLEGCGISVEAFNAGLAACTTEQEKQAYMLQGTEMLLGAAGEAYRQNNADIIAANEAQSAYNNALAGLGALMEPIKTKFKNGMAEMITAVTDFAKGTISANELISGLGSMVGQAIDGISAHLPKMGEMALELINVLSEGLLTHAPKLLDGALNIVVTLLQGLANNAQKILSWGGQLIVGLVQSIIDATPKLLQATSSILASLSQGIEQGAQNFIHKALDLIEGFADTLVENVPTLVKNGMDFIRNLVKGLMNSLPELIERVPEIISKFAQVVKDAAPTIIAGGVGIIKDLIVGIIKAIPTLVKNIPKIIKSMVDVFEAFSWKNLGRDVIQKLKDGIVGMVGKVKEGAKNILDSITNTLKSLPSKMLEAGRNATSNMATGIRNFINKITSAISGVFNAVVNGVKNLPSKLLGIGKDLVTGLWNGITNKTDWIINKIKGFGDSVLGGIKKFFGINSPSKVMQDEVGRYLAEGVGVGIAKNEDAAIAPMQDMVDKIKGIDVAGEWGKLSGAGGSLNYDVSAQLGDYVSSAINTNSPYAILSDLIASVEDLANRAINLDIDGMRFATATAGATDNVSGNRLNLRTRGLAM